MRDFASALREILRLSIKEQASDVHFSVGHKPVLRIDRELVLLNNWDELDAQDTKGIAQVLLNEEQKQRLESGKTVELSYAMEEGARFRTSIFYQRGALSIAMRLIPSEIKSVEELNLPPVLHSFTQASQGFVLITGPSSHGKSTTLAALIEEINIKEAHHIITIEDPIEYYFKDKKCIIDQRELGRDTLSFSGALRDSFRQDPDVIMVGEMRDRQTVATALSAAETGHLVFSTLHTNSAAESIHRIVDIFPGEQQSQIRAQLSASLLGVASQRLIPRMKGGLIPACEILISTPAVSNLIRQNKIHEIPLVIETSADMGMITLNKSLANLVRSKEISFKSAVMHSSNPKQLERLTKGF